MTFAVNIAQGGSNNTTFRNRILNGAMMIDQRNAGASVTPTVDGYTLDRWAVLISQSSKFSVQQNAGSVTPPVGFRNYLGVTSTSAYSVLTGDYFTLRQAIEGFNTYDFAWGTANAQPVTLSFWVRSSLTGTFGGSFQNNTSARSYPFTYTISSANTWEQKTVTIAGDTSGTWQTGNLTGVFVYFNLGTGTTFSGTAGAWAGSNFVSATGAVSVVGTNGATWYITGVQLEEGTAASPFEFRQYGTELALCQRYYESCLYDIFNIGYSTNGVIYYKYTSFNTTKRAAPTMTYGAYGVNGFNSTFSTNLSQVTGVSWQATANYTGAGSLYAIATWTASAEL